MFDEELDELVKTCNELYPDDPITGYTTSINLSGDGEDKFHLYYDRWTITLYSQDDVKAYLRTAIDNRKSVYEVPPWPIN